MNKNEVHELSESIAQLVEKELEQKTNFSSLNEADNKRLLDHISNLATLADSLNLLTQGTNAILNSSEYDILHDERQIVMPTTAKRPDTGALVPLEDFVYTSTDPNAATVDQNGLIKRVQNTTATFVSIKVDYVIVDTEIGRVKKSSYLDYIVYQPNIVLDISSTEVV